VISSLPPLSLDDTARVETFSPSSSHMSLRANEEEMGRDVFGDALLLHRRPKSGTWSGCHSPASLPSEYSDIPQVRISPLFYMLFSFQRDVPFSLSLLAPPSMPCIRGRPSLFRAQLFRRLHRLGTPCRGPHPPSFFPVESRPSSVGSSFPSFPCLQATSSYRRPLAHDPLQHFPHRATLPFRPAGQSLSFLGQGRIGHGLFFFFSVGEMSPLPPPLFERSVFPGGSPRREPPHTPLFRPQTAF